jgi:signal peptidase I
VELQATLRHVRIQRRLEARVAAPEREEIERLLRDLWDGLESQDDEALGAAAARLRMSAAAALAEQARADTLRVAVVAGLAGLVAVLLRAEVASAYTVLGVSMLPSLAPGDVIVGDAWTYHGGRAPRRGDLVVFHSSAVAVADPATPPVLVKRVIGLPGDRVRMEGGVPVINGWRVPTCDAGEYVHVARDGSGRAIFGRVLLEFLEDRVYLTLHTGLAKPFEPYRVEPGTVFVLGDSRTESADSRAWNGGRGGGVPLPALVARGGWFVSGVALDGGTDWKRVLRSLDGLALLPRTDEFDASALRDGIAKCLRERPPQTSPPALAAEQSQ